MATLSQSRERYAQALAHVGSWELELATNVVTWSAEAYRLYDVPMNAPVGYDVFVSRIHPEDRRRVEKVVGDGMQQMKDVEYEFRILRPNGTIRHVLGRNVVTRDEHGAPVRLSGVGPGPFNHPTT